MELEESRKRTWIAHLSFTGPIHAALVATIVILPMACPGAHFKRSLMP